MSTSNFWRLDSRSNLKLTNIPRTQRRKIAAVCRRTYKVSHTNAIFISSESEIT